MKKESTGLKKVIIYLSIQILYKTFTFSHCTGAISLSVGFLFGVTNIAVGHVFAYFNINKMIN